ncbi:HEAT repeat domain-containing protein [Candidatus Poribacteria bacterium]|nr:HEAT repeat domain-containing protein [Candidatus Poribacteria bacterium]
MTELIATTRELLQKVESSWGIEFEKALKQFVTFARQQPEAFDDILVEELGAQYQAFQSDENFTGATEYALICALWERPTPKAVPVLCKILVEDPTSGREEIVQILRDVGDKRAVEPLLSVLETLDDAVDEGGHLRSAIAEALGAIGDPCALPALHRLEATPSADGKKIAHYVKWAIEQLENET